MDRTQKAEAVKSLNGLFADAGAVVVAHYTGMTVAQMGDLRLRLRKAGASFRVAKNRLAVRAVEGTQANGIADLFKGPTVIAFSKDPVAAAKVATDFARTNDKLVIIGGAMGKTSLNPDGVKALASLPSLDELRGKLVGLLRSPAQRVAQVVAAPAAQLARVVGAYAKKSEAA